MTSAVGPAVSPDSTQYFAAARNLVEGHGLRGFDGTPMVSWPPLLPLLMALFHTMGLEMLKGLRWFYIALDAFVLGFSVWWLTHAGTSVPPKPAPRKSRPNKNKSTKHSKVTATAAVDPPAWAKLLFGAAAVVALPQLRVASTVWSELLFIALALVCLWAAVETALSGNRRTFIVAIVTAALALLTRYSAVALVVAISALFLLVDEWPLQGRRPLRAGNFPRRIMHGLLFAVPASFPLALWMLRNWRLSGTLTGPRYPTGLHLGEITSLLGASLPGLFLPDRIAALLPGHFWLLLFAAMWGGMLWLTFRALRANSTSRLLVTRLALLLYLGAFFLVLAGAFVTIGMDAPNIRLWAPLVLPALIVVALHLKSRQNWVFWFATAILAAVTVTGVIRLPSRIHRFQTQEAGFALPVWQESPLVRHLRENHPRGVVLSDYPEALYYLCGIEAQWTPRMKNYGSHNILIQQEELLRFENTVKRENGATIAWFQVGRSYLFPLQWLRKYYPMKTVSRFDDGEIAFVPSFQGSAVKGLKEKYRNKKK